MSRPKRTFVTVAEFMEAGKERLGLELVGGRKGTHRPISEAAMNRPGLALTGFFQYFAHRRIQVFGHAENAYLSALSQDERTRRLRSVFEKKIPCLVITRGRKLLPEIGRLSEEFETPVFRSPLITMDFVNAATIIMESLVAPRMIVQGTMVEILGIGTLIEGKAGIGKSETALALVKRGHSLVADDVTSLWRSSDGVVMGSPVGVTRYHMEIRGLGIIHVPSLFGVGSVRGEKQLDLIVSFVKADELSLDDQFEGVRKTRSIFDVSVPVVVIPVAPGRDMANLVETAALDQKLRRLGHDAAKELDEKLMSVLSGGNQGGA